MRGHSEPEILPSGGSFEWFYERPVPPQAHGVPPVWRRLHGSILTEALREAEGRGVTLTGEPATTVRWLNEISEYDSQERTWRVAASREVESAGEATLGMYRLTWTGASRS